MACHLRGMSFDFDPLHLDNLQQKLSDGGKYLQRGGSEKLSFSTERYV